MVFIYIFVLNSETWLINIPGLAFNFKFCFLEVSICLKLSWGLIKYIFFKLLWSLPIKYSSGMRISIILFFGREVYLRKWVDGAFLGIEFDKYRVLGISLWMSQFLGMSHHVVRGGTSNVIYLVLGAFPSVLVRLPNWTLTLPAGLFGVPGSRSDLCSEFPAAAASSTDGPFPSPCALPVLHPHALGFKPRVCVNLSPALTFVLWGDISSGLFSKSTTLWMII